MVPPDNYKKLNTITKRTDVSAWVMEIFIQNYEDGDMTDDEFVSILKLFGKEPGDFGFDLSVDAVDIEDLDGFFGGGGVDEG